MDHSRKMLRFRDMLLFLNPPTQHEALLRARSAALAKSTPGCEKARAFKYIELNEELLFEKKF